MENVLLFVDHLGIFRLTNCKMHDMFEVISEQQHKGQYNTIPLQNKAITIKTKHKKDS